MLNRGARHSSLQELRHDLPLRVVLACVPRHAGDARVSALQSREGLSHGVGKIPRGNERVARHVHLVGAHCQPSCQIPKPGHGRRVTDSRRAGSHAPADHPAPGGTSFPRSLFLLYRNLVRYANGFGFNKIECGAEGGGVAR